MKIKIQRLLSILVSLTLVSCSNSSPYYQKYYSSMVTGQSVPYSGTPVRNEPFPWLSGDQIYNALYGNTSEAYFLEGNNVQLLYWSPDRKVISKARNQRPLYVGDWYTTSDTLCIRSRGGDFCYYVRSATNHLEGWAIKSQGTNRSLLLAMYQGDAFSLIQERQDFREGRSWKNVANIMGLAIVGTAMAALVYGTVGRYPDGAGGSGGTGGGADGYQPPRSPDSDSVPYSDQPDTSIGCAWGDRRYSTCIE
jgi:hypothetical protein